ncbi:MAG: serine/threonine-protein kinase [Gammaproteobacteria bacterium]|nr:serine/threonine-protein kinase [Gammaproteobacteria bacterium]
MSPPARIRIDHGGAHAGYGVPVQLHVQHPGAFLHQQPAGLTRPSRRLDRRIVRVSLIKQPELPGTDSGKTTTNQLRPPAFRLMKIPGYVIKDPIGKGGMATAYLALQESLGREVVLKVLDTRNVQNADMVERFLAEGRIVASLNHPNIITIFDIGISGEELYISMEYVQGGDLKQRIKEGLSAEQTLDYLAQLASGLKAAHSRDIVHRDIKPANILFREDGTPLVTDFGIAKQTTINSELTSTGMFLGSPNYVSPEQADGLDVDGRTDIYSLGCVLYEMLTGSKPFEFSSVIDIVIQHKQAAIPKLPEELSEFQPLLEKMMAKKPEDRFAMSAACWTRSGSFRSGARCVLKQPPAPMTTRPATEHHHDAVSLSRYWLS